MSFFSQISVPGACCKHSDGNSALWLANVPGLKLPRDCKGHCHRDRNCSHISHSARSRNCMLCSGCALRRGGHYTSWIRANSTAIRTPISAPISAPPAADDFYTYGLHPAPVFAPGAVGAPYAVEVGVSRRKNETCRVFRGPPSMKCGIEWD